MVLEKIILVYDIILIPGITRIFLSGVYRGQIFMRSSLE